MKWPTVVASPLSIKRRAEGAAAKRKATPQVSKEDAPIVGTQGSVSTAPTRTRKPARPRGAPLESLAAAGPSTSPATGPSTSLVVPVTGANSAPVEGRVHGVFLEPLHAFVAAVSDPNVDGLTLGNQLTLGTNTDLLIRYMSSKLQTNGRKTSPVITLQMLGFFRIY